MKYIIFVNYWIQMINEDMVYFYIIYKGEI